MYLTPAASPSALGIDEKETSHRAYDDNDRMEEDGIKQSYPTRDTESTPCVQLPAAVSQSDFSGNETDPADHRGHMTYPAQLMAGTCPEGYEMRVPSLFFETIWNTYAYLGVEGSFVLANGDPTGKASNVA